MEMTTPMNSSPTNNATDTTALYRQQEQFEDEPGSSYVDPSDNDLTMWPGAALIVADCMGTGILALPNNMKVLGAFGLIFLVINLPINYYAGDILNNAAFSVENRLAGIHPSDLNTNTDGDSNGDGDGNNNNASESQSISDRGAGWNYDDDQPTETTNVKEPMQGQGHDHHHYGIDTPHTFDFIGITYALFDYYGRGGRGNGNGTASVSTPTILVTAIYYTNIFLVLGNYILVMSHAVAAIFGEENICLPTAGIIASILMFAISQLRTMATLGRSASIISLLSLAIVVFQCLAAIQLGHESFSYNDDQQDQQQDNGDGDGDEVVTFWKSLVSQLAALSSIGFAVGSQKLFLNIRHEFKDRKKSPNSLAIALVAFGTVYLMVCVLAGPDPPSLLFDAIASGVQRQIAGFLLWVHVAVSFAINSQALCSSLDRLRFHRVTIFGLGDNHRARWAVLTFLVAVSSYFIANAVPFFKDLVALIGALTSVPLTLLLPALYHRKVIDVPLFWLGSSRSWSDVFSLLLVVFSVIFLVCGVIGSLSSIGMDWANHGPPFACH